MARKSTPEPEMRRKTRVKANILHVNKEGIFDSAGKSAQIFDSAGTKPGSQKELLRQEQQQQETQTQSPMAKLKQMALRNSAPQQPNLQVQSQVQTQVQPQQQQQPQQQTLTTRLYLQNKSLARQNSNLNTKMSQLEHHLSELISENICLRQKNLELQRSHDNWLRGHVNQNIKKQLQKHLKGINELMQGLVGDVEGGSGDSEQLSHESAFQEPFEMSISRSLSKTPDSRAMSRGSPASGRNSLSKGSASRQTMGPADFGRRRSSRRRSSFFGDLPLLQDTAEDVLDPSAEQLHLEARDVVTPMADDVEGWGEVPADEVSAHMEEMHKMEQEHGEEADEMDVDEGEERVHFNEIVEEHEPEELEPMEETEMMGQEEDSGELKAQEMVREDTSARRTSFPSPFKDTRRSSFHSPVKESRRTSFPSPVRETETRRTSFPSPVRETETRRTSFPSPVRETSFPSPVHDSFPSLIQETSFASPEKPAISVTKATSPVKRRSFSPIDEYSFPSPFSTSFRRVTSAPRGEPMEEVSSDGDSFAFIQQRHRPSSRPGSSSSRPSSRGITTSRPGTREKQIKVFADPVSPVKMAREPSLEDSAPVTKAPLKDSARANHTQSSTSSSSTPPRSRASMFDTPESTKERQEKERKRRESMEQVVEQPESPIPQSSSRRTSRRASAQQASERVAQMMEMEAEDGEKRRKKVMKEEIKPVMEEPVTQKPSQSRPTSADITTVESLEKPLGMFEKGLEKLQSLGNNVAARKNRAPTATGGVKVTTSRKTSKVTKPAANKGSALMQKDANGSNGNSAGAKGKLETVKTTKLSEKPQNAKVDDIAAKKQAIKLEVPEPRSRRSRGAPVNYKLPSVGAKLRRDTDGFVDAVGGLKRSMSAVDENGMKRRRI